MGACFTLIGIIFSSCSSLSVSLSASPNHKSLLDAITALARQWKGGRIDSRAEDERGEGEKRCCKKITVAYAHRKHIDCKIKSQSLTPRLRDPLEVCGPRRYVGFMDFQAQMWTVLDTPIHIYMQQKRVTYCISSFTTELLEQNRKTDYLEEKKSSTLRGKII